MNGVITFVITVLAGWIAAELPAWMSRWAEQLLKRAVAQVPQDLRERIDEEWHADLVTWPSGLARLIFAGSLWFSSARNLRDGAGRWSLFFSGLGRLIVGYAKLARLTCQVAWLTGRVLWTMPHMRAIAVLQAIVLIALGCWIAYGYPVLYWVYVGAALASMGTQMWLTPLIRIYLGVNCANFVLATIQSAHPIWFPAGFVWGYLAVFILSTVFMIRKMLTVTRPLEATHTADAAPPSPPHQD